MKTAILAFASVLTGAAAAYWIFGILWVTAWISALPSVLMPFGLAATASLTTAWLQPGRWLLLSALVALPMVLLATVLLAMLWMENRIDWNWAWLAAAMVLVCTMPAWLIANREIS